MRTKNTLSFSLSHVVPLVGVEDLTQQLDRTGRIMHTVSPLPPLSTPSAFQEVPEERNRPLLNALGDLSFLQVTPLWKTRLAMAVF